MSICKLQEWMEYESFCERHFLNATLDGFINYCMLNGINLTGRVLRAIIEFQRDSDIATQGWTTRKINGSTLVDHNCD